MEEELICNTELHNLIQQNKQRLQDFRFISANKLGNYYQYIVPYEFIVTLTKIRKENKQLTFHEAACLLIITRLL